MEIAEITDRTDKLIDTLIDIWESAVRATHSFLSNEEIGNIKRYVPDAIKSAGTLIVAYNDKKIPIGFMGITEQTLDMLFVADSQRGRGIGKKLLTRGIKNYRIDSLTVNEQNPMAKGFYDHMGFKVCGRTDNDEQGNPYPILYMKYKNRN